MGKQLFSNVFPPLVRHMQLPSYHMLERATSILENGLYPTCYHGRYAEAAVESPRLSPLYTG